MKVKFSVAYRHFRNLMFRYHCAAYVGNCSFHSLHNKRYKSHTFNTELGILRQNLYIIIMINIPRYTILKLIATISLYLIFSQNRNYAQKTIPLRKITKRLIVKWGEGPDIRSTGCLRGT